MFKKLNEVNKNLQGSNINFTKFTYIISAFNSELDLFKENISRREYYHFYNYKDQDKF